MPSSNSNKRVFALEFEKKPIQELSEYTCYMNSMGKTYTATEKTETKAKATVLDKCAKATNAIHCDEEDVKCGK